MRRSIFQYFSHSQGPCLSILQFIKILSKLWILQLDKEMLLMPV